MRQKMTVIAILCAIMAVLSLQSSDAVVEGRACAPEPEVTHIRFGEFLVGAHCQIEPVGDTDIVRFTGNAGETIILQVSRQDGANPCIELFDPHGTRIGREVCRVDSARMDATLEETGDYTVRLSEWGNNGTVAYGLILERVVPPSPAAKPLCFGCSIAEEINGIGDIDSYTFQGTPGDTVTVQVSRQDGANPCIELFDPHGTRIGREVCRVDSARMDATLEQEGIYTVVVSEWGNNGTVAYRVDLQCIGNCPSSPSPSGFDLALSKAVGIDANTLIISGLREEETSYVAKLQLEDEDTLTVVGPITISEPPTIMNLTTEVFRDPTICSEDFPDIVVLNLDFSDPNGDLLGGYIYIEYSAFLRNANIGPILGFVTYNFFPPNEFQRLDFTDETTGKLTATICWQNIGQLEFTKIAVIDADANWSNQLSHAVTLPSSSTTARANATTSLSMGVTMP